MPDTTQVYMRDSRRLMMLDEIRLGQANTFVPCTVVRSCFCYDHIPCVVRRYPNTTDSR